jgi:hypothetical protein
MTPAVRTQDRYVPLTEAQFRERFFARFYDPAFDGVRTELERVCAVAWDGYIDYRNVSHEDLDENGEIFEEVKNAARSLTAMAQMIRTGAWHAPDEHLRDPREK